MNLANQSKGLSTKEDRSINQSQVSQAKTLGDASQPIRSQADNEEKPQVSARHQIEELKKHLPPRSKLQRHDVMKWLRHIAKSPSKAKILKEKYYLSSGEISAEKQLEEMFKKLDTDGSNAISMDEMQELFSENGIVMKREEIAEMFSVVKRINDQQWLAKEISYVSKKPYVQSMAEKLKL